MCFGIGQPLAPRFRIFTLEFFRAFTFPFTKVHLYQSTISDNIHRTARSNSCCHLCPLWRRRKYSVKGRVLQQFLHSVCLGYSPFCKVYVRAPAISVAISIISCLSVSKQTNSNHYM